MLFGSQAANQFAANQTGSTSDDDAHIIYS